MQKEEITPYVVSELVKHHNRNEIIRSLCEQAGMMWPEAEKLVRQIQADHSQDIRARQSPTVIWISILSFILGAGLIIYCIAYFFSLANHDALGMVRVNSLSMIGTMFVAGIGMIAGATLGLWKIIRELFEDKENR